MDAQGYRSLSLWHDSFPGSLDPRPALRGEARVDVAIVGAGFTGLWTAWYLKQLEPTLRIALVEAETAGFGASGRNGGWCTGSLAGIGTRLEDPAQRDGALRLQRALYDAVDEVGRVCAREGIDCHYAKGGCVHFASVEAQRARLEAELASWRRLGFGEEDLRWLEPEACAARVGAARNLGGTFSPHCAAIHPLRLVRGLADRVEAGGVAIYERTRARAIERGRVVTESGRLEAAIVVRATEGYTPSLPGGARALVPIHSMMIATEPLPEPVWKEIGLPERETFADARRVVIYGQRTADGRLAFGARGLYRFGSRVRDRFAASDPTFGEVEATLRSLFPALRGHRITHRWGGPLGVPRDWQPRVGLDRARGLAWAGGYVGEGVAASNLFGRTLAELIAGRESERVALPHVAGPFPPWEPEPLRWLAATGLRRLGDGLDRAELAGRPTSARRRRLWAALVGK